MNKEDFVSLECAKMLKEKGYNEPCLGYYFKSDFMFKVEPYRGADVNALYEVPISPDDINAPTLYEAAKWIRQHCLINIIVCCNWGKIDKYSYAMNINQDDCNVDMKCKDKYQTYESALSAGIVEALKMI